jgi:hypothetical protein
MTGQPGGPPHDGTHTYTATNPAPLEQMPDGVRAFPVYQQRYKAGSAQGPPKRLYLRALPSTPATDDGHTAEAIDALTEREIRFLGEYRTRKAASLSGRFRTLDEMAPLIRARVLEAHLVSPPQRDARGYRIKQIVLTDAAWDELARRRDERGEEHDRLHRQALDLALQLNAQPEAVVLAEALLDSQASATRRTALVAAAEALLRGEEFTGVRAFSSRVRGDTKLTDIDRILREIGASRELLDRLGVRRVPEIALAGPITVATATATIDLTGIRGPIILPLDQSEMHLSTVATTLLAIENKEAARYAHRRRPSDAIVWTGGFASTSREALGHLTELAASCPCAYIICDADLDGVHIAAAIHSAIPHAVLVDAGTYPHTPRRDRPYSGTRTLDPFLTPDTPDPLNTLARGVLERGYDVEQEDVMPAILDTIR